MATYGGSPKTNFSRQTWCDMKVFVLGANGMLGRYVYQYLRQTHDVIGFTRASFEAPNFDRLEKMVEAETERLAIVNCIGAIKQKHEDAETLFAVNGTFPVKLAKFVSSYSSVRLLHISSDCVFSGKSNAAYTEHCVRDATDWYGQSKIIGEECRHFYNCKVLRTSILGEDPKCHKSLLEWMRQQTDVVNGYTNHFWNGVTCLQLAKTCGYVIENFYRLPESLYHVHSPDSHSKSEILELIARAYDLQVKVNSHVHRETINRRLQTVCNLGHMTPLLYHQLMEQKGFLQGY